MAALRRDLAEVMDLQQDSTDYFGYRLRDDMSLFLPVFFSKSIRMCAPDLKALTLDRLQPLNGFIALHKVISSLPCRGYSR